jgi:sulfite reductase beta subunit-like hemoprotein
MPYIDACITRREFQLRWISNTRYEVIESIAHNGGRTLVGCVHVARTEQEANRYIGSRVGGLTLSDGRVVDTRMADLYRKAGEHIRTLVEGL